MIKNYIIVGAGLSGLNAAKKIQNLNLGNTQILEKSRGVGGRMATRRTLETRFDHGAQFYKLRPEVDSLHQQWDQKDITRKWFYSARGEHWCAKAGMTSLAKSLAEALDIQFEKQVRTILWQAPHWKLITDKGEEFLCENLILSSPTPQSVNLLQDISQEPFFNQKAFSDVKNISYTKSLIGLITTEDQVSIHESGYLEFEAGEFFSIADQKGKGISDIPAYTLTMSANFSETHFDLSDNDVLDKILSIFTHAFPMAKLKGSELKKWRYCMPTSRHEDYFLEIAPKLYLIGDAFGGSSLLGAVRSSDALCEQLKQSH